MSLFDVRDFWAVTGELNDIYGNGCLSVADINEDGSDEIIIGNYNGLLKIFAIERADGDSNLSFKPSDLLLETDLMSPILHIVIGLFVSGSRAPHIAILHSRSISVFSFNGMPGSVEHGNQFGIKIIYEHTLQRSCYQLICGQFGGVKNRDFLCAVSLDGTLTFFEQETYVMERQLPLFLLPTVVVYVPFSDTFIILNADWYLEGYRYQTLVDTSGRKINSFWSYNLGETVINVSVVENSSVRESSIVILSERSITCFYDNGSLKFTKRLQCSPLCSYAYFNEFKSKIMTLLVTDGGILFIYEETTLLWSAKLPLIPVAISIANLPVLKGALVILSEAGDLKCGYLGTQPSLFVAPPLENSVINYKDVSKKLDNVEKEIAVRKARNSDMLSATVDKYEVLTNVKITYNKSSSNCSVMIDLQPSGLIFNLLISLNVMPPFSISPNTHQEPLLCDKKSFSSCIYFDATNKDFIVPSLDATVVIGYATKNETARVIRKICSIPLKFALIPCKTPKEFSEKVSIEVNQPPVPLCTLFQEFVDEHWTDMGCDDESASFNFQYNKEKWLTVSLSKNYYGYVFTSDSLSTLSVFIKQTIHRCTAHRGKDKKVPYVFTHSGLPSHQLFDVIDNHANIRNEIKSLEESLEKLSAQYRLIQRRMLVKLRDKQSSSDTLQVLYKDTYEKIIEVSHDVELKERMLIIQNCELYAVIELTLILLQMTAALSSEDLTYVRNSLLPTLNETSKQGWEETTEIMLTYLLKTKFAVSTKDHCRAATDVDDKNSVDSNRLKKLISSFFDRIVKGSYKKDQTRVVSTILENEEDLSELLEEKEDNRIETK